MKRREWFLQEDLLACNKKLSRKIYQNKSQICIKFFGSIIFIFVIIPVIIVIIISIIIHVLNVDRNKVFTKKYLHGSSYTSHW